MKVKELMGKLMELNKVGHGDKEIGVFVDEWQETLKIDHVEVEDEFVSINPGIWEVTKEDDADE